MRFYWLRDASGAGGGHDRRPRLPSSRNRLSRKDIAHKVGGAPLRPTTPPGPTESLNPKINNAKRMARRFRNFGNYRLRLLLNHGRVQNNHQTSRIRTRRPSLVASSPKSRNPRRGLPDRIRATRARIRYRRGDHERADFQCRDIALQGIGTVPSNHGPPSSQRSLPAQPCTATARPHPLRAEPSITVTAIISARCRRFLNPTRT